MRFCNDVDSHDGGRFNIEHFTDKRKPFQKTFTITICPAFALLLLCFELMERINVVVIKVIATN